MIGNRICKVYIEGVHSVYEAEWCSLIERSGNKVELQPEDADLILCMGYGSVLAKNDRWERLATLSKPIILGRANPGCYSDQSVDEATALGVRNHIISHARLAERTRAALKISGRSSDGVFYVPKCHDLTREAAARFGCTTLPNGPVAGSQHLTKIVTLINHYQRYWVTAFAEF